MKLTTHLNLMPSLIMSSWRYAYKLSTRDIFSLPLDFETGMKAKNFPTATVGILATSDGSEFSRAAFHVFTYIAGNVAARRCTARVVKGHSFSVCPSVSQLGSLCCVRTGS